MNPKRRYLLDKVLRLLDPPEQLPIDRWAPKHVRLPSDTTEPGWFDVARAPYQREILRAASPDNPCREIVLVFGSQMGKTMMEEIIMLYYIAAYPRPQAFAFPGKEDVKIFTKQKFNPLLGANPDIRELFAKSSTARGGDTLDLKLYQGGSLRMVNAGDPGDMRGYSVEVGIMDEIDNLPATLRDEGNPIGLFRDRTRTFSDTRKIILSSTPRNSSSLILDTLAKSTDERYLVPCPHCKGEIELDWSNMRWETKAGGREVTSAWMECPLCGRRIHNNDKTWMLDPANGAHWQAMNLKAPASTRGFFLPALYAPVGWDSWQTLCQNWVNALNSSPETKEGNMISFYNTTLCRQYRASGVDMPRSEEIAAYAITSPYLRGKVPSWVGMLTTGSDVQKNRIETTVMGWGRRGHNIVIDHIIFELGAQEDMGDLENGAWENWRNVVMEGQWEREDGFALSPLANALDRSYKSMAVDTFYTRYDNGTLYPIRGIDGPLSTNTLLPARKESRHLRGAVFYDAPVSEIKKVVYSDIRRTLSTQEDGNAEIYDRCDFPSDLPMEFFDQLVSESYELDRKSKRMIWTKTRERNEALDTRVYNYCAWYLTGANSFDEETWDMIFDRQAEALSKRGEAVKAAAVGARRKRRIVSAGF